MATYTDKFFNYCDVMDFNSKIQMSTVRTQILAVLSLRNGKEWRKFMGFLMNTMENDQIPPESPSDYTLSLLQEIDNMYERLVEQGAEASIAEVYRYIDHVIMFALLSVPETRHGLNMLTVINNLTLLPLPTSLVELQFRNMVGGIFGFDPIDFEYEAKINLEATEMLHEKITEQPEDEREELIKWMHCNGKDLSDEMDLQYLELIRNNFLCYRYSLMVVNWPDPNRDLVLDKKKLMLSGVKYLEQLIVMEELSQSTCLSFVSCAFELANICFEFNALPQAQYLLSAGETILEEYRKPREFSEQDWNLAYGHIKYSYCLLLMKWFFLYYETRPAIVLMTVYEIPGLNVGESAAYHTRPLENTAEVQAVLKDTLKIFSETSKLNIDKLNLNVCHIHCKNALTVALTHNVCFVTIITGFCLYFLVNFNIFIC